MATDGHYMFAPIAFENLGVPSASARQLLSDLGWLTFWEKAVKPIICFWYAQSCHSALTQFFCTTVYGLLDIPNLL